MSGILSFDLRGATSDQLFPLLVKLVGRFRKVEAHLTAPVYLLAHGEAAVALVEEFRDNGRGLRVDTCLSPTEQAAAMRQFQTVMPGQLKIHHDHHFPLGSGGIVFQQVLTDRLTDVIERGYGGYVDFSGCRDGAGEASLNLNPVEGFATLLLKPAPEFTAASEFIELMERLAIAPVPQPLTLVA